jgi:AraC-like DNA-binding protein
MSLSYGALNGINICPQHRQPLVAYCPKCKESQQFLTQTTRPGYCSHCACWLGKDPELKEIEVAVFDTTEYKQKLWNAEVGGRLLAAAPGLPMVPPKAQIATMLKACMNHYTRGNKAALARLLKIGKRKLSQYLYYGAVPSFDVLLNLGYLLSIPPLEFLTGKPDTLQTRPRLVVDHSSAPLRSKRKPIGKDDTLYMRQSLERVLGEAKDPFPSFHEIARAIGYHEITLSKHCPDLCREVIQRSRHSWTGDEIQAQMKEVLEAALVAEEPLSLQAVARQLGCDSERLWTDFPDLCRAIVTRYRQRVDSESIRHRLEHVLSSNERVSSVAEIAREMGYDRSAVLNRFPQLCAQISARYRAERRRLREKRVTENCEEIRRVTFMLHSQGIYPSSMQISRLVRDHHSLRRQEEHEAWRLALEELGYPTDHSKKYT